MTDKLKIFVTKYDEKLYLNDKTDYPLVVNGVSYNRDEFAIAVNYSYNDFIINSYIDLSNEYSVALKGGIGDILSMMFYLVPVYTSGPYSNKQVVFKDDIFYASKQDNNMITPSPENQYWTVLTESNAIPYLKENASLGFPITYVEMYSDIPVLELFSINKLLDRKYEIIDNSSEMQVVKSKQLFDYENNLIGNISNIFEVPSDGVYKVVITYDLMVGNDPIGPKRSVGSETVVLLITHMDDIECCYKLMIKSLYCKGSDYCLDNNCFQQREKEYKLNEISNIYNTLIMDMKVSRMQFYNIMPNTDDKEKYVQEVGRLVKIIKLIIDDCKNCCDGQDI